MPEHYAVEHASNACHEAPVPVLGWRRPLLLVVPGINARAAQSCLLSCTAGAGIPEQFTFLILPPHTTA